MAQDKKRKKDISDNAANDVTSHPNGAPRKKQRTYTQENATFAKIYEDLAHEVGKVRLDAAKLLLTKLSSDPLPDAEVFEKVLKRLVRGLCSSRKAARSGFFVAFTEYLRLKKLRLPGDESESEVGRLVQRYVSEGTTAEGKASTQEKHNHAIGRVLAYQAMIESKFVFETFGSEALWKAMLQKIFSQAQSMPRLREEYCSIINSCIPTLAKEENMTGFINDIFSALVEQKLEDTPEGIALWLTALTASSKVSFPTSCWYKQDPLHKRERARLTRVMKGVVVDEARIAEGADKPRMGGNQTRLNFAWNTLILNFLNRLDNTPAEKAPKREKKFAAFWKEMVDDILFAESASPERKSLGLQLLTSTISTCPAWAIPSLFSSNVVRCIVNQRANHDRLLHEAAKAPLDNIRSRAREQPEIVCFVIETLVSATGTINFDHLTKTKTVGDIINGIDAHFIPGLLSLIESMSLNPTRFSLEIADLETVRRILADMMLTLTRSRKIDLEEEWTRHVLRIFLNFSYVDETPNLSRPSREGFRSRLSSCINHMISSESKASEICYMVISHLEDMRASKDHKILLQADEAIQRSLEHAIRTVLEINRNQQSSKFKGIQLPISNAFACLYTLTVLQVYNEEPDAVSMLDEIDAAYKAVTDGKDSEKEAFELLVEVLLGMVSKQSALSRKVAEQAFTAIAPELTPGALQSMLDVLGQKENTSGQNALFDQNQTDGGDDTIEGLDDSDVEEVDQEPSASDDEISDDAAEECASERGSSSEGLSKDDEEEMQRLNASLAEILKTGRSGADEEVTDDESMDDEQMMALEPRLTNIFQERKKAGTKKQDNKDAKKMMIHFKNRVLDLLTIYIKQQHANPLALDMIVPLLRLISESTSKQLSDKTFNLLKQYIELCGKRKEGLPTLEDGDSVWAILETVLQEVGRNNSKLYQNACSRSSLFLVKVLSHAEQSSGGVNAQQAVARAQDMFSGLQKQWMMDPKLEIQLSFFQNWLGWCNDVRRKK